VWFNSLTNKHWIFERKKKTLLALSPNQDRFLDPEKWKRSVIWLSCSAVFGRTTFLHWFHHFVFKSFWTVSNVNKDRLQQYAVSLKPMFNYGYLGEKVSSLKNLDYSFLLELIHKLNISFFFTYFFMSNSLTKLVKVDQVVVLFFNHILTSRIRI